MSERDIIERLMDFEGEGRTAQERVKLRELAAVEIHRLRENHRTVVETKRRTNARLQAALDALQKVYTISGNGFESATGEDPPGLEQKAGT